MSEAPLLKTLRLLADPTRLRLLALLEQAELTVAEAQEILRMGQSRISTHLAQLKRAGLVRDRRAGKNIFYGPAPAEAGDAARSRLREIVRAVAAELPETPDDTAALAVVLRKREERSREYFNRVAGRFARTDTPGRSWPAFSHLALALLPPLVIADLGAGEGTVSQLLARRASKVIAVDLSEKMVEFAAESARQNGFANLEFRLGDMQNPPLEPESVDVAVFSQALHHAANPGGALAAAHRILRPGGRIVVLDLLAHQFEQARELWADLWLGFSEVELLQMLEAAGFTQTHVTVVAREEVGGHSFQTVLAGGAKR